MKHRYKLATDHRAVVLESIATSPYLATNATVCKDCMRVDFSHKNVLTMINTLWRAGLVGRIEQGYFLTRAGFEWLTEGRFDQELPRYAERPKSRKPTHK